MLAGVRELLEVFASPRRLKFYVLKGSLESCCQVEWPLAMWLLSPCQTNGKEP